MSSPSYPPPSEYESADTDFTGYADSELERREVQKRARYLAMADRAKQNLEEHVKQTAKGLFDDEADEDPFKSESDSPSKNNFSGYIGRSVKERHVKEILNDVIDNVFKKPSSGEIALSSTSKAVYPAGLNPVPLPKSRPRAITRKGTKREGDEPESVTRRIKAKSQPPHGTVAEAKPRGRLKGSTNKPKS